MHLLTDSPERNPHGCRSTKQQPAPAPAPKMFHATVLVTRAEEWCVEAERQKRLASYWRWARGIVVILVTVYTPEVQELDE
jgi:hypothetical protein